MDMTELENKFAKHHDAVLGIKSQVGGFADRLDKLEVSLARLPGGARGAKGGIGEEAARESLVQFAKGMTVGTDPEGGYTVQPELQTVILQMQRNRSPMRRISNVKTIGASEFGIPYNKGGTAAGWVGETQDRPETDASQLGLLNYPANEIYAMPAVTQKLLDDSSVDIASFVMEEIAAAFDEKEADAWINGDGVEKPQGLLAGPTPVSTADATRASGTLQFIASGGASSFDSDGGVNSLITTVYSLKAGYRQNARWLMNSSTAAAIAKLKDAQKNYIWQQPVLAGNPPNLLGYPVEFDEGMPDIAGNAFPIAFGDFNRGYQIVDRIGIRMLRDPYTKKGWILYYTTKRVGGGLKDTNAIKLVKMA